MVRSADQLPPITTYGMRPAGGDRGRTYQYSSGAVAYPFGHGLSYTTLTYSPTDGSSFTPIHEGSASLRNVRVGVFAGDLTVDVDSFRVDQPAGVR